MIGHRVTWFAPDRPVEGNTIHVRPTLEAPMPDTDLAAAAPRVWLAGDTVPAGVRTVDPAGRVYAPMDDPRPCRGPLVEVPPAGRLVAAEQARRETQPHPRVWLAGDTVPAGVTVAGGPAEPLRARLVQATHTARWPLVEVFVPVYAAAVAAEQARRATTDGEVTE